MTRRGLKNAIASALIAELHNRDLPSTLRQVSQRQVMLANALGRVHGVKTKEVLPLLRANWTKVFGQVPESSVGSARAEMLISGYFDKMDINTDYIRTGRGV